MQLAGPETVALLSGKIFFLIGTNLNLFLYICMCPGVEEAKILYYICH